jgi:hypothetical protein
MRLLVSGATKALRELYPERPDRLGLLLGPGKAFVRSMLGEGMPYAADNACFVGLDRRAFLMMLGELVGREPAPLFVTMPDVVGDPKETLRRFGVWQPVAKDLGLKVALVGQDGLRRQDVPWDDADAYFVGGTDAWKESRESCLLALEARARGKHLHLGRVNTLRRIMLAAQWGCDTIDGTGFTWFSDVRIPKAVRWIDRAVNRARAPSLFVR